MEIDMNLKYYLRGLGIGIIVTALIMGIAVDGKKETLSDSEIMERARALGMTEENIRLSDVASTIEPETEEEETQKQEEALASATEPVAEPTALATAEPTLEPTLKPTAKPTLEPTVKPTTEPTPLETPIATGENNESPEFITIQVDTGDGSHTVCRKLEEAGLVISASDFDMYLYENGYDKRINVGSFEIPVGADPQQIARILAGLE